MIIFKDLVTGDEIVSDGYPMKEIDDVVYEIECKKISKGTEDNFDIGANPSAEEVEEGVESNTVTVIDVVDAFRMKEYNAFGTKKDYTAQLKSYLKKVVEKLKEQGKDDAAIKDFQTKVQGYFSKVIGPNFKDYEFFIGETMEPDGMVSLLNYREDGITPYLTIWKHGLSQMKV